MKVLRPNKQQLFIIPGFDYDVPTASVFHGPVSLGNMTQYNVAMFRTPRGLFVGIEGKGAFTFGIEYVHQSYVAEKLGLGPGDAGNVADFIHDTLALPVERQGMYYDQLLTDEGY